MNENDPGMGIFTINFNREVSENGNYYSINFDWRERETEDEKKQLELIATFMNSFGDQLIDMDGTRDLICVDGWSAQELQNLVIQRQQNSNQPEPQPQTQKPGLPAA